MTNSTTEGQTLHRLARCPNCKKSRMFSASPGTYLITCPFCQHQWEWEQAVRSNFTPSVAIIGTEGSGKTVLVTTLAKHLSTNSTSGVYMDPQGVKTLKYVERVWQTLQSGEWPPSTPPGELFELKWKYQIQSRFDCEIRIIDSPGQDLRQLFEDEQVLAIGSLPNHLQNLAKYCRTADIVLFLVNLKDFLGQPNSEKKTSNEAAIKAALDYISADGWQSRFCLVLTQADQYKDSAVMHGGWERLVAKELPYVFNSHVRGKGVPVIPVAAVNETKVITEKGQKPRRVPKEGFRSLGLPKLVSWLTEQIEDIKREIDKENKIATEYEEKIKEGIQITIDTTNINNKLISTICIIIIGFGIFLSIFGDWLWSSACFYLKVPSPVFVKKESMDVPGFFDDVVIAFGTVRNDGFDGKIKIFVRVTENGKIVEKQETDTFLLTRNASVNYKFELKNIHSVKNKHTVETWCETP